MDEETDRLIATMGKSKEIAWSSVHWNKRLFHLLTIVNILAGAIVTAFSGVAFAGFLEKDVLALVGGGAGIVAVFTGGALSTFKIKDTAVAAAQAAAELESVIHLLQFRNLTTQAANSQYVEIIKKNPELLGGPIK